ncbi:hypothetical protein KHQ06_12695 [Nocardia tengchongensis]|uniref:Uncharacterized protein n=1 Tax=Nocardia tengchongensis TaxID=2055889 RepID=A0ABX8CUQ4_9NOCA|nr:hypothetical protein [Nocardia tengchongensis]QVI23632.1 hypothetical protein KHQ06_12695 [Nocardia tengchongensis]
MTAHPRLGGGRPRPDFGAHAPGAAAEVCARPSATVSTAGTAIGGANPASIQVGDELGPRAMSGFALLMPGYDWNHSRGL